MASNEAVTPKKQYCRTETNICRLCGDDKESNRSTSIFGKVGQGKEIAESIKRTLNIVIVDGDGFPCNVCRKCQDLLKKFDNFKTLALNTQEMIKSSSFEKRCSKSPLAGEPGKKGRTDVSNLQPHSSSKRLEFSPTCDDTTSQNTETTNSTNGETLAASGLNNKPVCVFFLNLFRDMTCAFIDLRTLIIVY